MAAEQEDLRAVDGRVPGRRGRATRQRLLDETAILLGTTSFRDLKVIDIAREAGTSPATFYQYFIDVESAVLALAEDMLATSPLLAVVRDGEWTDGAAFETALVTTDVFLSFFDEHQSLLRVVDLATAEGDDRFRHLRAELLNPVATEMAAIIVGRSELGHHPADLDPMAQAGVLVTMLAHISSRQPGFEQWGIGIADLRVSLARQLCWGVTGLEPST